jgi:type II secretory pathway component GspD/PulD (secretin)
LLIPGCQTSAPETPPEKIQKPDDKKAPAQKTDDKKQPQASKSDDKKQPQVQPAKSDDKKQPQVQPAKSDDKKQPQVQLAKLDDKKQPLPVAPVKPEQPAVVVQPEKNKADETLQQIVERRSLAEQQKAAFIQHLVKTAKAKISNHEYNAAKSFLEEALKLDPTHAEVLELRNLVGSALGEPVAQQSYLHNMYIDEVKVKIEQAKLEARNHYKTGVDALNAKDYEHAIREFEAALEIIKWAPYPLGLDSLRKQAENKIKEARDSREKFSVAQQEEKTKQAQEKAQQLESEEQARRATQIRMLLDKATEYYIRQKYDQSELMVKQVLELDNSNKVAKKLQEDIREASHSYIAQKTLDKRIEGWKRFLENMRESAIPLSDILYYPDKDYWHNVISKRQGEGELGQSKKDKVEDTPAIRRIKTQLESNKANWSFSEISFQDVVTYIRNTNDVNVVVDPKVIQTFQLDGTKVSLELRDIRLKDALNILLELYNLLYLYKDDVLFITAKNSDLAKEAAIPVLHDIRDLTGQIKDFPGPRIKLTEAKQSATGGGALFTEETSKGGAVLTGEKLTELIKSSIAPDSWGKEAEYSIAETSGQLLVVHTEKVQQEIRNFLNDMRRFSGMMVAMESRFLEVTDDFLEQIGVDWRGLGNDSLSNPSNDPTMPGVGQSSEVHDNNARDLAPAAGLFFREDPAGGSNSRDPLGRSDARIRTEHIDDQSLGKRLKTTGGLALQFSTLDDIQLSAILWMVKKTGRAEVLMAPRLTAFNTQRANITVVDQWAYIKDFDVQVAQSAYIADPVIGTIQTGVVFDVRPIIANDRRYITLELRPTVADLQKPIRTFTTTLGASGREVVFEVPTVRLQSVESTVRLPDQGTLLIGGLKTFREIDRKLDIPVLGNIPIISFFFSQRAKVDEKQNLIILITAKIIDLEEQEEKIVGTPK